MNQAPNTNGRPAPQPQQNPQQNYPYPPQHNPYVQQPQVQQAAPQQNFIPNSMDELHRQMTYSTASGNNTLPYVVMQVTLKEKFIGSGSANLVELENVINTQVALGYRLHTVSTATSGTQSFFGGDRMQATLVFERLDLR